MKTHKRQQLPEKKNKIEPPIKTQKITNKILINNPQPKNMTHNNNEVVYGFYNNHSSKKINHQQRGQQYENNQNNISKSNSNISRARNSQSFILVDKVVQLHERLKNLHHFYKTRIEDQKNRVSQRNQVFMGIVQQMQRSHNQKVETLRKMVEQAEGQKKDVGLVDERMNEIKGSIDEILKQSADLKSKNERLERQINEKAHSLREKEQQFSKLKEQLTEACNQLELFQRLNLKQNKKNKQILMMIDKTTQALNTHS